MLSLLCWVRCENMRGRLYWPDAAERTDMSALVRRGLVLEVPSQWPASIGYVAVPFDDFDAVIDATQEG